MLTLPALAAGCVTLFLLLHAAPAAAQGTFAALAEKVKTGQKIIVHDEQGAVTEGTIQEITASTLVVDYFRGRVKDPSLKTARTFTPDDVRRVQKPAHLWDGAIKGAAVALIPVALFAAAECYDCGEGQFAMLALSIGAAAGVGIDALSGPKTIYRRDATRSRIALAPVIGRERKGLAVSLRF
jgi:hypothetical protein